MSMSGVPLDTQIAERDFISSGVRIAYICSSHYPTAMIGTTVAQYQILEQLGSGGMGVVYKATDTKLHRTVALKFLPTSFSTDEKAKVRFMQEARAASSLDDPHICTIHDIAETDDGKLFIVMSFYDGKTLKYLLEERPPSMEEACGLVRQVAKGLTAAHEAGIVHRDIKPANIMVTGKGLVKVLDFGVAKLGGISDLTQAGSTIGTASYMSPEQARGEEVDARSDIWALGIILYELLAGRRPFAGGYEAAMVYSIINETPDPLPDPVPEELAALVMKCLEKSPDDRYASARDLARALTPFADPTLVQTVERAAAGQGQAGKNGAASDASILQNAVMKFSLFAFAGLAAVYVAMLAFGLPDWVFPLGVGLMLIGLPIVLYAVRVEKKRAHLNSGERARLQGLQSWLTTKRAFQGGVVALAVLGVVAGGFLGLRAAGIGPFATLMTAGTLSAQDALIVAAFDNATGEPTLGNTVTEALRIDLSQSTAFRLVDRSTIQAALQRMQLRADTVLSPAVARQVAEREGVKAVIEGDINQAGAGYIINTRIVSVEDGSQLVAFRESVRSDADVLDAIDRTSAKLREQIGESVKSIRSSQPLAQVTTRNIEALRLYTEAEQIADLGRYGAARDMMQRVVRMDPEFAMAYRKLAVLNQNAGGVRDSTRAWISRGHALRDRLPVRERLLTEAYYYSEVELDEKKEAAAYEEVLRRYPFDEASLNNLAIIYNQDGRFAEAEELLRRALTVRDGSVFRLNLLRSLAGQRRYDEYRAEVEAFDRAFPGQSQTAERRAQVAFMDGDLEGAAAWIDSMRTRARFERDHWAHALRSSDLALAEGRMRDARRHGEISKDYLRRTWPGGMDADMQALFELQRRVDRLEEEARLTADTRALHAAVDSLIELDARVVHSRDSWALAMAAGAALASTGRHADAVPVLERLERRADELDQDLFPFLRFMAAYSRGMTGDVEMERAIETLLELEGEFGCNRCTGLELADLELKRGNTEAAERYLAGYTLEPDPGRLFFDEGRVALALFRLGAVREELGRVDEAIEAYEAMAERWQRADPVLQPQVAEARRRVQTLLDRKAREGS